MFLEGILSVDSSWYIFSTNDSQLKKRFIVTCISAPAVLSPVEEFDPAFQSRPKRLTQSLLDDFNNDPILGNSQHSNRRTLPLFPPYPSTPAAPLPYEQRSNNETKRYWLEQSPARSMVSSSICLSSTNQYPFSHLATMASVAPVATKNGSLGTTPFVATTKSQFSIDRLFLCWSEK
jgi:hypothetical protein